MYIKEIPDKSKIDEHKFWNFVLKRNENECWIWMGGITSAGYGLFPIKLDGEVKLFLAHRISYILTYPEEINNLYVCHRCDNRICVNPKHLFSGTNSDNSLDMHRKGRVIFPNRKGEKGPGAKLTEEQVKKIRELYKLGVKQKILAQDFGVKQSTISAIIKQRLWTYIK